MAVSIAILIPLILLCILWRKYLQQRECVRFIEQCKSKFKQINNSNRVDFAQLVVYHWVKEDVLRGIKNIQCYGVTTDGRHLYVILSNVIASKKARSALETCIRNRLISTVCNVNVQKLQSLLHISKDTRPLVEIQ